MTIGFEHSKLRYMYDEESIKTKLDDMVGNLEGDNEFVLVEGGKTLLYGASVRLDTISLAKYTGGKLILMVSGDEGTIIDKVSFVKRYVDMEGIDYSIVINKVGNIEDYKEAHLPEIKALGVDILGVIPGEPELTRFSMGYLAERLQARIIAGENGLKNRIKNIFVGSMSGDAAVRAPKFNQEDKLVIASGDRSDYIVGAIDSSTAGIILTDNILPPQNLISKASEKNIPILLVPYTTFETAKQVDDATPLLTREDTEHIQLLQKLVSENTELKSII
jgi:hypothetical protein